MKMFVAFDDTDTIDSDFGTGKLTRWFENELPEGCHLWGVVRQQLPVMEEIPYTSHNSSACAIIEAPDHSVLTGLIDRAVHHVERHSAPGSDPGVCVACENDPALARLKDFGLKCSRKIVTQKEALSACAGIHLSGHGGTNDGIIGAAAAVFMRIRQERPVHRIRQAARFSPKVRFRTRSPWHSGDFDRPEAPHSSPMT